MCPVTGNVKQTGKNQVTITATEMDETEFIIENVQLLEEPDGKPVGSGEEFARVIKPTWCADKHIHLSMRKIDGDWIDPTKYLKKRKMPPPKWREYCDFYVLKWKVCKTQLFFENCF